MSECSLTFSAPKTLPSVSASFATTRPLYINRMRSGTGLEETASRMRLRSSLIVVVVGRSVKVMPPSTSLDGERILRLMVEFSSAILNVRTARESSVMCSGGRRVGNVSVYVAFIAPNQLLGSVVCVICPAMYGSGESLVKESRVHDLHLKAIAEIKHKHLSRILLARMSGVQQLLRDDRRRAKPQLLYVIGSRRNPSHQPTRRLAVILH